MRVFVLVSLVTGIVTSCATNHDRYIIVDGCPKRNPDHDAKSDPTPDKCCEWEWEMGMPGPCDKNDTQGPTQGPTAAPSKVVSSPPSDAPSLIPTVAPSRQPTVIPSKRPSRFPTRSPSVIPSQVPSDSPSEYPTWISTSKAKCPDAKLVPN